MDSSGRVLSDEYPYARVSVMFTSFMSVCNGTSSIRVSIGVHGCVCIYGISFVVPFPSQKD